MHRVAVFVDAGYLFAAGGVAITGTKVGRADLTLDASAVIAALRAIALERAAGCSLLRIYWYDGAFGGTRLTADQALLATQDDVKVRLGFINSAGQQKGVDSLIVTDLIELARQKAICDALLLSGDEDVRVGVQIAQNYGVRVHLLGIAPSRGNQSLHLQHEADTIREWPEDTISSFLSARPPATAAGAADAAVRIEVTPHGISVEAQLQTAAEAFARALTPTDIAGLEAYWRNERGIPSEMDRRLLPHCRSAIGDNLDDNQKRLVRRIVQQVVREAIESRR